MTYDIIVVGSGPAGLTAALYSLRADKTVLVLEKSTFGGQIVFSPKIENYPAVGIVSGNELADKMVEQVTEEGCEFDMCEVTGIKEEDGIYKVVTDSGDYLARAVIIATGARHRQLGVPGENKFCGEGVSYCAVCDGAFFEGQDVAVIGGGNSALQEAVLLSETSNSVTLVQNLDYFTGEKKLLEKLRAKDNVSFITGATVMEIKGEDRFEGIVINTKEGEKTLSVDGVFVAIGLVPQNEAFRDVIDIDSYGYAASDETCLTKTKGIFVAGDCRSKGVRQITTAAADGAVAALNAIRYLS